MAREYTMNELRKDGLVCDGIISTGDGGRFPIHRIVLCVFSPYFRAHFTNSLHSDEPELSHLHLDDCSAEVTSLMIEFAYTSSCSKRLETDQLAELLIVADRLLCDALVNFCSEQLTKFLNPSNCGTTLRLARTFSVRKLESAAWCYLCENMEKMSLTLLEPCELCALLSSDDLVVSGEEAVFNAVADWVRADPPARVIHVARLMDCVRLGRLDSDFFFQTVMPFEHHTLESRQLVESVSDLVVADNDDSYYSCYYRPRLPNEILFTFGGWSNDAPTDAIETYDMESDTWLLIGKRCAVARAYHGVAVVDGKIYLIGGYDGVEYYNTTYCFDPVQLKWSETGCMHKARCHVSCCALGGEIYAIGGYTGHIRLNSAEKYNPETNQWTEIHPMHRVRSDASAAVMGDKIYVAGGFNGEEGLSSVEVYDPKQDQWTFIDPMTSPRSGLGMTSFEGALYVFGGFDGDQHLVTGEKYSHNRGWQPLTSMGDPISNMSAVILDRKIALIGGFNDVTTVASAVVYDPETDSWAETDSMRESRSAMAACVVQGLPNAIKHTNYTLLSDYFYNEDNTWSKFCYGVLKRRFSSRLDASES